MVKRCVELDPSIPDFHHLLACMLGFVGDYKNGLRAIDRAIELLPNQTGWLYERATFIRLAEDEEGLKNAKYSVDVAEAYFKFLKSNPEDHRKFPEALYSLAHIYFVSGEVNKAKAFFLKGLQAEDPKIRLPCLKPVEHDFPLKTITRIMINASEGKKMSTQYKNDFNHFFYFFFYTNRK